MKLRNLFKKIIKFVLFLGFFSVDIQSLAKNRKFCPKDFPSVGTKFEVLPQDQWKITITKSKNLKNAINNESLAAHIGVLELDVVEELREFANLNLSNPSKMDIDTYKIEYDNSWSVMKRSIAAMQSLGTCIRKDLILFSGEWTSESIKRVNRIIDLEEAFDELFEWISEDPKFDFERFEKKYPRIVDTEDPKVIKQVINNLKKNKIF